MHLSILGGFGIELVTRLANRSKSVSQGLGS